MNKREHILTVLIEECLEIGVNGCKALRFGLDDHAPGTEETNAQAIAREFGDLYGMLKMAEKEGLIDPPNNDELTGMAILKRKKVEHWLNYARERGTLTDVDKQA